MIEKKRVYVEKALAELPEGTSIDAIRAHIAAAYNVDVSRSFVGKVRLGLGKPVQPNKSQAIRDAYAELGAECSLTTVKTYLLEKGIKVTSAAINNALNYVPDTGDMASLQKIAQKLGGLKRLRRLIDLLLRLEKRE